MSPFDDELDGLEDLESPFPEPSGPLQMLKPRAALAHVLQRLTTTFVGDAGGPLDATLTTLAILISKWICEPFPLRLLLVGATGSGKTRLLHAIAEMTRAPSTVLPVTQLAETSWQGLQFGEVIRTLHPDAFHRRGLNGRVVAPPERIQRPCCLLLDEIDKLALITPTGEPLDGAARAWRLGRQHTLMACIDPLAEVPCRLDDVDGVVRWSSAQALVIGAGAFPMFGCNDVIAPASLQRIGFTGEFVDRLGVVLRLPEPSESVRRHVARIAAEDMLAFAQALDVEVTGLDGLLARLPAPGSDAASYVGVRGLRHDVERRIADAIATAIARAESVAYLDIDAP